ncbi:hypothetical protein [Caproicibacterium sp. BJN0003]|uniref:hypothetical protein n=1 Tax=Caproicibacterium sp. BJN0003 TaxID=2994078 RepID=UPI0022531866|nr:hypothetical protein [Caproicibacterium sp. BJN0003]UZT82851.1 hypothetical protein OP489_03305 [Caproicibacterium sp. BJN0003]
MDQDIEIQIIESFKQLVRSAVLYAKQADDYAMPDNTNLPAAIAYLQRASSKMSAAEALYWAQHEILMRNEAEIIFKQFDAFADELVHDYATDHSQQWTDIQFNKLMDAVNDSAFALQNS